MHRATQASSTEARAKDTTTFTSVGNSRAGAVMMTPPALAPVAAGAIDMTLVAASFAESWNKLKELLSPTSRNNDSRSSQGQVEDKADTRRPDYCYDARRGC